MAIAAVLFLIILALGAAAYWYYLYSPAPRMPPLSAAIQRGRVRVGDRQRSYLAYVPAKLPSGSALVIALHGSGMDGMRMREWTGYEFDRMATSGGSRCSTLRGTGAIGMTAARMQHSQPKEKTSMT